MRVAIVIGLTAIYAVCFIAIKAGLAYAPPLAFAALRTLIAGAALLAVVVALRQPALPPRRLWPGLVGLALSATAAAYGAMFVSPGQAGAGIASVLGNLQPVFVVGLAALVLGERMTRGDWASLLLGVLGAVLIAAPALEAGVGASTGALLAVASSLGFAAGSVLIKRLSLRSGLLAFTAWSLLLGSLPLLTAAALVEGGEGVRWSGPFVGLLLFLALPGTALATAVWYWLVEREDIGRLSMVFFLVPVFGLGLAVAIFDERLGQLPVVGVVLIFAGVGPAIARSRRGAAPSATPGRPAPIGGSDRP